MRKLTRQELRDTQVKILDEIHEFCNANNITYMLAYGTLIGAVRHKGFIPWDDDLDIMMPRPDYERFCLLYKDNENFGLLTIAKSPKYNLNFGRVYDKSTVNRVYDEKKTDYGVFVDVYPMDGAPDSSEEFKTQLSDLRLLTKQRNFVCKSIAWLYKFNMNFLADVLYSFLPGIMNKREGIILRYAYESHNYCSCISSSGTVRHIRRNLEETTMLPFEGKYYMAPKGYDSFLREYYGDYMKLPPEEQRVPYHLGNYYWK